MNELQAQLADLEAQKEKLFENDTVDSDAVSQLNEKIKAVQDKIAQQQQAAQVETKVAEAQAQVSQSFDAITIGDQTVTLSDLAANEPARQILSIYFTQYVTSLTEQNEKEKAALKASYESQIADEKRGASDLQNQYDTLYEASNALRIANAQLQANLEDMTARRNAAAQELAEEKAETTRLNSQVDDLRTEIAIGARAAVKIASSGDVDLGQMIKQYKTDKQAQESNKPAIYDVQPTDQRRSTYTAKLAENGEAITFNYLEKGKYREVSPEEAERFRAEAEAAKAEAAQTDPAPNLPLGDSVITPPPFQEGPTETVPAPDNGTVGGDAAVPEVVEQTEPVTRAEFEALKRDVEALKQGQVNGVAA